MDSSSVQQDVLLDDRSSNGVPHTSEELLDCKAKSGLPVTRDEMNSKLFHVNFLTTCDSVVWVMLRGFVFEVKNLLYSIMQSHSLHQTFYVWENFSILKLSISKQIQSVHLTTLSHQVSMCFSCIILSSENVSKNVCVKFFRTDSSEMIVVEYAQQWNFLFWHTIFFRLIPLGKK